ncbi:hypothetical protein MTO96_036194 [Rhipicephalus appendiculatus]
MTDARERAGFAPARLALPSLLTLLMLVLEAPHRTAADGTEYPKCMHPRGLMRTTRLAHCLPASQASVSPEVGVHTQPREYRHAEIETGPVAAETALKACLRRVLVGSSEERETVSPQCLRGRRQSRGERRVSITTATTTNTSQHRHGVVALFVRKTDRFHHRDKTTMMIEADITA